MIFKIDIDGVLRDIITPMCELYNKKFETSFQPSDVKTYDVSIQFPLIKERLGVEAHKWFFQTNGTNVFLTNATAIEGARAAIKRLRENGHKVVIASFQPSLENKIDTLYWLNREGIEYDDICFTKDKHIIEADYIIDDNPKFLNADKAKTVLVRAAYNGYYEETADIVVNTLKEFVDSIL